MYAIPHDACKCAHAMHTHVYTMPTNPNRVFFQQCATATSHASIMWHPHHTNAPHMASTCIRWRVLYIWAARSCGLKKSEVQKTAHAHSTHTVYCMGLCSHAKLPIGMLPTWPKALGQTSNGLEVVVKRSAVQKCLGTSDCMC